MSRYSACSRDRSSQGEQCELSAAGADRVSSGVSQPKQISETRAQLEPGPQKLNPRPSGRVFPELRAPLYRSLTNRGCDTLHQTDGGYFIRRLRLNLIEQIDKNHSVPTNESTNMIEPDQWDGVLGSVTGTIYRGTERVSSSRLSAPRSWMRPGRRLTLSCLAMASGPIETTHQETDTPSATREPRSCGTASPCGANIVSRRKLLLQRQKRQKRPTTEFPPSSGSPTVVSDPDLTRARFWDHARPEPQNRSRRSRAPTPNWRLSERRNLLSEPNPVLAAICASFSGVVCSRDRASSHRSF